MALRQTPLVLGLSLLLLTSAVVAAPLVAGHRGTGASSDTNPWPENSLLSLMQAFREGADLVEVDVQLTRDGIPVLFHDEWVDTAWGKFRCRELLHTEFPLLVGPTGMMATVPSLRSALRKARRMAPGRRILDVELKVFRESDRAPLVAAVAEVLRRERLGRQVLVSSFDIEAVSLAEAALPGLESGLLGVRGGKIFDSVRRANEQGHEIEWVLPANWRGSSPSVEFVRKAHAAGLRVGVWNVNKGNDLRAYSRGGYDLLITDVPDRAREIVDAEGPANRGSIPSRP